MTAPLITDPLDLPETPDRDIDFDAIARGVWAAGPSGVKQLIDVKVQLVVGEIVWNLDAGVDYFGRILGKPFDQRGLQDIFRVAIASVPGVASVTVLASFKRPQAVIQWTAVLAFGGSVSGTFSQVIS